MAMPSATRTNVVNVLHVSWVARNFAAPQDLGLGDVALRLPKILRTLGINTQLVIPGHPQVREKKAEVKELPGFLINEQYYPIEVRNAEENDLPIVSLGNPQIFRVPTPLPYALYGHHENPRELLKRIVHFTWSFAQFLKDRAEPVHIIAFHDWPTGLCLAMLKAFGDTIFRRSGYTPNLFYYEYEPNNKGLFLRSSLEMAEMGLAKLALVDPDTQDNISLLEVANRFADKVIKINDIFKPPEKQKHIPKELLERRIDTFAYQEISLYRRFLPFEFRGMEHDLEHHPEHDRTLLIESLGPPKVKTPEEKIKEVSPYAWLMFYGPNAPSHTTEEERTAADEIGHQDQQHIFAGVRNDASFQPLKEDLPAIDFETLKTLSERAKAFDQVKGQLEGTIKAYDGKIESISPGCPEYQELCKLGTEGIRSLVRVTLAAGKSFTKDQVSDGTSKLAGLKKTLFEIQAEDIARAQERYRCDIPWIIMIPDGERGDKLEEHIDKEYNKFGLDVHLIRQKGISHIVDPSGRLVVEENGHLQTSTLGHGTLSKTLTESEIWETIKSHGHRYAFVGGIKNLGSLISDETFLAILGRHMREGEEHAITAELVLRQVFDEQVNIFPVYVDGKPMLFPGYTLPRSVLKDASAAQLPFHNYNAVFSLKMMEAMAKMNIPYFLKSFKSIPDEEQRFLRLFLLEYFIGHFPSIFINVPLDRHILYDANMASINLLPVLVKEFLEKESKISGSKK